MIPLAENIQSWLPNTFQEVDGWFDRDEKLRTYKPQDNGWTIDEILEHITLTNRYLLILIEKGKRKASKRVNEVDLQSVLEDYTFSSAKFENIGRHQSFLWVRPEHMEPQRHKNLSEVRHIMKTQVQQCVDVLQSLANGEGLLYKTMMSVDNLGKLNVYEYIYFLAQHARRHVEQMEKNKREFLNE
ncbi:DinB family protein [Tunicatimonas pelagia]|uniref:DinB family protein n=1 Tax=Tunicatimonas pelagia TaxID=931531 RepID=UPI002666B6BE|nr:DinB family protein [Tunicatimonas pelagia]WKN46000.1 DinB family protein [Tunicatimonas pelagia]